MRVFPLCGTKDVIPVRVVENRGGNAMNTTTLVRKIHMECPLCDKLHELEERKRTITTILKGEEVTYEESFYFCANADEDENEFETASMTNENLLHARNAYRVKTGLLTSDEIVGIREKYGLSQVDLAKLLGWGEATISRYESKAIQDEAYDAMLRLIKEDPMTALEFLKKNASKFSEPKKAAIRNRLLKILDTHGKEFLTRQTFKGEYVGFDEPSDSNGYKLLDIDKIETIISYLAESMLNLYKVKLMKSLWYVDVLSFIRTGRAMTGLVYRHETMGALPIGHYSLMNLENVNVQEEPSYNLEWVSFRVYPSKQANYDILNKMEKRILDEVIKKFKDFTAPEIVDYMHGEKAYKETTKGAIIPFSLAKDIKEFA